jgi:peptide/nickel transport system permease protein
VVASSPAEQLAAAAGSEPVLVDQPPSRLPLYLGIAMIVGGVVLTWLALVPMGDVTGTIKVPLTLIGILAAIMGIDRTAGAVAQRKVDTGFWLCTIWVTAVALAALLADWLPLGEHQDSSKTIADPRNLRPDLFSKHPLGTNNQSLDMLAQCIYGARVSLLTAIFAVTVSIAIGGLVGMIAGYFRGASDATIGVLNDTLLSFPPLILLIALAAVLGRPTTVSSAVVKTGVALAIVGIPTMLRLSRANTMMFSQREFVLASRGMGAKDSRILFRELLPNVLLPIISYAFLIVAVLIIAEGSLSYLGLGLQQPKPTWGNMIAQADLTSLRENPHIALVPGVFMFVTVYAFNRIGERARGNWDSREAKV